MSDHYSWWKRIKLVSQILWSGYSKYEGEFCFRNEDHIMEFMEAIGKSVTTLKDHTKALKYCVSYKDKITSDNKHCLIWAKNKPELLRKFNERFKEIRKDLTIDTIKPIERPMKTYVGSKNA